MSLIKPSLNERAFTFKKATAEISRLFLHKQRKTFMSLNKIETGTIVTVILSIIAGVYQYGQMNEKISALEEFRNKSEEKSLPKFKEELETIRNTALADFRKEKKRLSSEHTSDLPIGTILSYFGTSDSIPTGFLALNGQHISNSDYPALFKLIAAVTGSPEENYIRVPNLKGQFLRGWGKQYPSGTTNVGDFQKSQVGSHQHTYSRVTDLYSKNYAGGAMGWIPVPKKGDVTRHSGEGGDGSNKYRIGLRTKLVETEVFSEDTETRPDNFTVLYIIKAK